MSNTQPETATSGTRLDPPAYQSLRDAARRDPERYWLDEARRLDWETLPTRAIDADRGWYADGRLNASVNCLDRHLETRGDQVAVIWQAEDRDTTLRLTYRDLHGRVCRLANVLRDHGVKRGDRVAIHLPGVVEGIVAMLACARLGALHVVLFGGFSAEAIADRLADSAAVLVITANVGRRGAKRIPFKTTMDKALALRAGALGVRSVLVVGVTDDAVPMQDGRDASLEPLLESASPECAPEIMASNDPLFLLYTSGSTGKPKGIVHGTGGYLTWASFTQELVFDHKPGDIFWCTADIGWITGHSYVVYGPLSNGGTVLLFEGMPSHPGPGRWWEVIQQHAVTTFYTSPTAIRALMREGDEIPAGYDLSSLRVLGSVGEPISHDAWTWFHDTIGQKRCPMVDTWWQTETGGIMISVIPGAVKEKPASATLPLPGVEPVLLDDKGHPLDGVTEGVLCLDGAWPGRALTIWNDDALFQTTYLKPYPGHYFTGDGARRDEDGYYWITGRVDDVINVSGHRIGSAEIEDALATDHAIAESAAIGVPHDLKGQGIVIYLVPRDASTKEDLATRAVRIIADKVGRYAVPERVLVVPDLPKTRSGKNVRRLMRKIACGERALRQVTRPVILRFSQPGSSAEKPDCYINTTAGRPFYRQKNSEGSRPSGLAFYRWKRNRPCAPIPESMHLPQILDMRPGPGQARYQSHDVHERLTESIPLRKPTVVSGRAYPAAALRRKKRVDDHPLLIRQIASYQRSALGGAE